MTSPIFHEINAHFIEGVCIRCGARREGCSFFWGLVGRCCKTCLHPLKCDCPASVGGWCCVGNPGDGIFKKPC